MSGTGNALAIREEAAAEHPVGALAIYADQADWTPMQQAALDQLGLKDASDGDRLVFLHVAQRMGLDPFAKQIHMIGRKEWDALSGTERLKWTIQTGIDGFRVNRSRAERKAGVRGILGQAVYIDGEGNEYKRWFKPAPPVGCEITYTVRELTPAGVIDTPYTSYLRFTEYAQYKRDGKLNAKWSNSPAHMLEKCTEADVYRKAFPQDFSGVQLDDAMPSPDGDHGAAPAQPERPRVTAEQARARRTVPSVVEDTPDVPPAQADPSAESAPPPTADAGGTRTYAEDLELIQARLGELGVHDAAEKLRITAKLAGVTLKRIDSLRPEKARAVADTLDAIREGTDLAALLEGEPGE